jgi:aminoglycoside phosphotransferase (APT) family kinase protein
MHRPAAVWLDGPMAFLDQLHAGFGVPRSIVAGLVLRASGNDAIDIERVIRGYDNEVHRARLADGRVVYVRIGRTADKDFDGELWAMEQARAGGVPVPEVLLRDAVEDDRPVMVLAAAPGRPLDTVLGSLSPDRRHAAMVEIGRTLAVLNAVPVPGLWRPDEDGVWPDAGSLRSGFVEERMAEAPQLRAAGFSEPEIERAFALLDTLEDSRPDPPVLSHGDATVEHVFVDDELRVTCLIDWGMWGGGSALADLAYASMVYPARDFAGIVEGHGDTVDLAFRRRLGHTVVGQAIGNVAHHVNISDAEGLVPYVAALRQVVDATKHGWASYLLR